MKLHQLLAIEKDIKVREHRVLTDLYHLCKKTSLFAGMSRVFRSCVEGGEIFPPEKQIVQKDVDTILSDGLNAVAAMLNSAGTKDNSNLSAVADVAVDGVTVLSEVPVTHLLHLEKVLSEVRSFVGSLPELDPSEDWVSDENTGLRKTGVVSQARTKKVQKPIVLYDATPEHPAQTQMVTEDIIIGHWDTIKFSGGISTTRKRALLERVNKLADAVKIAREAANSIEVSVVTYGDSIRNYILG